MKNLKAKAIRFLRIVGIEVEHGFSERSKSVFRTRDCNAKLKLANAFGNPVDVKSSFGKDRRVTSWFRVPGAGLIQLLKEVDGYSIILLDWDRPLFAIYRGKKFVTLLDCASPQDAHDSALISYGVPKDELKVCNF